MICIECLFHNFNVWRPHFWKYDTNRHFSFILCPEAHRYQSVIHYVGTNPTDSLPVGDCSWDWNITVNYNWHFPNNTMSKKVHNHLSSLWHPSLEQATYCVYRSTWIKHDQMSSLILHSRLYILKQKSSKNDTFSDGFDV